MGNGAPDAGGTMRVDMGTDPVDEMTGSTDDSGCSAVSGSQHWLGLLLLGWVGFRRRR